MRRERLNGEMEAGGNKRQLGARSIAHGPSERRVVAVGDVHRAEALHRSAEVVGLYWGSLKPQTQRAYRYSLMQFGRWRGSEADAAGAELLAMPTAHALVTVMDYRNSFPASLSPATVNGRMAGLRSLVGFARKLGVIDWEIPVKASRVRAYRDTRGPGVETVLPLLERLNAIDSPVGRRDYAMARLLFDLGLRRGGVVGLRVEDLDVAQASVWVRLKGDTQLLRKHLPSATAHALTRWIEIRGDWDGPLFLSFTLHGQMSREGLSGDGLYRVVKGWGRAVGMSLRPHGFRHTAISVLTRRAKAEGYGLAEIRAFSNHASVANLTPYLDAEDGAQNRLSALLAETAAVGKG